LRLYPTPDRREALWKILKKGFEALYREAKRIQRDREMNDRLW
jgi:hypothetical protein